MLYNTMALELLRQRPELHERLRLRRTLLATMDHHAHALKASHEVWIERLTQAQPGGNSDQIASAALEMALMDLEDSLPPVSPPSDWQPLRDGTSA